MFSENNIKAVTIRFKVTIIYKSTKCTNFFDFYLEFQICPENSDFPEVRKNKFAHGTDLNFYDKQKNVKTKIEDKTFSTVEELDTIRIKNCEVSLTKSDSRCGSCQVIRKHLTTITHRANEEKSKSCHKYTPSKSMLQRIWRSKLSKFKKMYYFWINRRKEMRQK